jgi:DNA processing protein
MANALSHNGLIDWIRLTRSAGVGAKTFRQLIEKFGTASEAIARLPEISGRKGSVNIMSPAQAEKEHLAATRAGLSYVTWSDSFYPKALAATDDAPPLLLVRGQPNTLSARMIAIVGARNATINGRKLTRTLAAELAEAGYVVISGMARGIDGAAHEGALTVSGAKTVAVLAGGTNVIYPPEHAGLYKRITDAGAVISEMPPGTEPQAALFPRRNRIISGASLGIVVVEATPRSGSLITARYAADQGRDVFAVPGSPLDPRAHGPNALIRDGAVLIQSIDDILSCLPPIDEVPHKYSKNQEGANQGIEISKENETKGMRLEIETALGASPAAVDELVRQCQVSPAVLATILLEMELEGRIERLPGNRVALIGTV